MSNLRDQIEKAKTEGARLIRARNNATRRAAAFMNKAAVKTAKAEAKEILDKLPLQIAERAATGQRLDFCVVKIGGINDIDSLRAAVDHPGAYVVEALLGACYPVKVDIDCSGSWKVNNELLVEFADSRPMTSGWTQAV